MLYIDRGKVSEPERFNSADCNRLVSAAAKFYSRKPEERAQLRHSFRLQSFINGENEEIIKALQTLFNSKCAYCETAIRYPTIENVDHFRPYRGAQDLFQRESLDHYYWLAYDWRNYYLCCKRCKVIKQAFFPVFNNRADPGTPWQDLKLKETSLLLDPCEPGASRHLVFLGNGKVLSAEAFDDSSEFTQEDPALVTIRTLSLNRSDLVLSRKRTIEKVLGSTPETLQSSTKSSNFISYDFQGKKYRFNTVWSRILNALYINTTQAHAHLACLRQNFVRLLRQLQISTSGPAASNAAELLNNLRQLDSDSYNNGLLSTRDDNQMSIERFEIVLASLESYISSGYEQAEKPNLQDRRRLIDSILRMGDEKRDAGRLDDALLDYEKARELSRDEDVAEITRETESVTRVSGIFITKGEYDKAEDLLKAALRKAELAKNETAQGLIHLNLGNVYYNRGYLAKSESHLSRARGLAESTRDRELQLQIENNLGSVNIALGKMQNADAHLKKALILARETSDRKAEAMALLNQGNLYQAQQDYRSAIKVYMSANSLFADLNDRHGQAVCALNTANLYQQEGNYKAARINYEGASEQFRIVGDKLSLSQVLLNVGLLEQRTGNLPSALQSYNNATDLQKSIGAESLEARTLIYRSDLLMDLHEPQKAIDDSEKAYIMAERIGDPTTAMLALETMAKLKLTVGDREGAAKALNIAQRVKEKTDNKISIARGLINLGNISVLKEQYDDALKRFNNAIKILDKQTNFDEYTSALTNIAHVYRKKNDYAKSAKRYIEAQELYESREDIQSVAQICYQLGLVALDQNLYENAFKEFITAWKLAINRFPEDLETYISALAFTYLRAQSSIRPQLKSQWETECGRMPDNVEQLAAAFTDVPQPSIDELLQEPIEKPTFSTQTVGELSPQSSSVPYIENVVIKNYKGIKNLEFETCFNLDEYDKEESAGDLKEGSGKWCVFLGENGLGKSSILQAICLALAGDERLTDLRSAECNGINVNSVRHRYRIKNNETRATPTSRIQVKILNESFKRELVVDKNGFHYTDRSSQQGISGLFCAYSIVRMLPRVKVDTHDPAAFNVINLFNPLQPLIDPTDWLWDLEDDEFNSVTSVINGLLVKPQGIESVNNDVEDSSYRIVKGKKQEHKIYVETGSGQIELRAISDGYASVIALACDIMYNSGVKFAQMQAQPGVVLVDEIGNNLHPRWKMRIVKELREAFPNIQFIVTTHEPLCLRGVMNGETHVLYNKDIAVGQRDISLRDDVPDPTGLRVDQLLTSQFFGLSSAVDPEVEGSFEIYYSLLSKPESNRTEEEQARILKLRSELQKYSRMGSTWRDQLILQWTDEFIAKEKREGNTPEVVELKEKTRQRIFEIWNSINLGKQMGDE